MELKCNNLTKQFGHFTAVDHLNLTMTNGVYGLLGVNGAGKTTLMRMLCTLMHPTSGTITCNGKDIFQRFFYSNISNKRREYEDGNENEN